MMPTDSWIKKYGRGSKVTTLPTRSASIMLKRVRLARLFRKGILARSYYGRANQRLVS